MRAAVREKHYKSKQSIVVDNEIVFLGRLSMRITRSATLRCGFIAPDVIR